MNVINYIKIIKIAVIIFIIIFLIMSIIVIIIEDSKAIYYRDWLKSHNFPYINVSNMTKIINDIPYYHKP